MESVTEDKVGAHRVGQWVKKATTWHYLAEAPRPALSYLLQEVHHNFVPLWVRRTYEAPDGHEETFGHHVIGLWMPDCSDERMGDMLVSPKIKDSLPPDWPLRFKHSVYEVRTLQGPALPDGRPGPIEHYDGDLIKWMKAQVKAAQQKTEQQRQEDWENAEEARRLKNLERIKGNQANRIGDNRPYWQRAASGEDMRHVHMPGEKVLEGSELPVAAVQPIQVGANE